MYEKFEICIINFSLDCEPGDYWYDCAILEATNILRSFDNSDWALLLNGLAFKSVFWKKRLVECLGELRVPHEIEVILSIIGTADDDLLIACIDALRLLDLSTFSERKKEELFLRFAHLMSETSPPLKDVLEDCAKKLRDKKMVNFPR